jgi:hypothetical protein
LLGLADFVKRPVRAQQRRVATVLASGTREESG